MKRNPSKKPASKFIMVVKLFLLILWAMFFKLTIELADDSFIIKEDRERVIEYIKSEGDYNDNSDVIIILFYLFIILLYIISLICVLIIFAVKKDKLKITLVALELLPILCYILVYNINSSVYHKWPTSSEKQEDLVMNSTINAINFWSYCEARYEYVEDAEGSCKTVLLIIRSYKNKEKFKEKIVIH
ncbi:MAG: hypothetical protein HQL65_03600 [Magnetococcales bacterium]|nr:hypothetical protein [Magnetococcales bacterium]